MSRPAALAQRAVASACAWPVRAGPPLGARRETSRSPPQPANQLAPAVGRRPAVRPRSVSTYPAHRRRRRRTGVLCSSPSMRPARGGVGTPVHAVPASGPREGRCRIARLESIPMPRLASGRGRRPAAADPVGSRSRGPARPSGSYVRRRRSSGTCRAAQARPQRSNGRGASACAGLSQALTFSSSPAWASAITFWAMCPGTSS